jgi:hypothetical protein
VRRGVWLNPRGSGAVTCFFLVFWLLCEVSWFVDIWLELYTCGFVVVLFSDFALFLLILGWFCLVVALFLLVVWFCFCCVGVFCGFSGVCF